MDSPAFFGINVPAGFIWCGVRRNVKESEMNAAAQKRVAQTLVDSREAMIIGVDLAKDVYQLAVADQTWQVQEWASPGSPDGWVNPSRPVRTEQGS